MTHYIIMQGDLVVGRGIADAQLMDRVVAMEPPGRAVLVVDDISAYLEGDYRNANGTFQRPGPMEEYIDGALVTHLPPGMIKPIPVSATKLGLKRAFAETGAWSAIKAALASDPDLQEDWDLATEISRTDPLTQAMITRLNLTENDVDALLLRAAALVG